MCCFSCALQRALWTRTGKRERDSSVVRRRGEICWTDLPFTYHSLLMITPFHPWFACSRCCCCCCCYCVSSYYSRSILFKVWVYSLRDWECQSRACSPRASMGLLMKEAKLFWWASSYLSYFFFLLHKFPEPENFFVSLFGHWSSLRYEKVIHPWIVLDAFFFTDIAVFIVAKV